MEKIINPIESLTTDYKHHNYSWGVGSPKLKKIARSLIRNPLTDYEERIMVTKAPLLKVLCIEI